MNVQAKKVWHIGRCLACYLAFVSSGRLGPWAEQCSGPQAGAAGQGRQQSVQ